MSLKKKVIILCLVLLLIIVITVLITSLFIDQPSNNSNTNVDNVEDINNNEEIPANSQVDIDTSEDNEEIKNDSNLDTNQNVQQEETNSDLPIVEEQEEVTNNNSQEQERPINENVSEENQSETEKVVCSNNDAEFSSFIARYKQENPTFYIVDSLEEAKEFGENAMTRYGYAYEYNSIPEMFEGTYCIKEIWYVRLTVPQQECTINGVYNDTMYLSANDIANITNIFDYLRNKGYDCGTKQWYY